MLGPRSSTAAIFDRRVRVTVDGFAMEGLRVGFTIEKDLKPKPNTAEIIVYNLSRQTRERLHHRTIVPVVIEAGYAHTGVMKLFAGELREAFSRPEKDGTWATVLRAGDGDAALRDVRGTTSVRPGISIERVLGEQFEALGVGLGNAVQEIKKQFADKDSEISWRKAGEALGKGLSGGGSQAEQTERLAKSAGLEYSIQDGQLQVLQKGQVLSTRATILSPESGLEGAPEVDAQGMMHVRARIVPGLFPGYPIIVSRTSRSDRRLFEMVSKAGVLKTDVITAPDETVIYRIEKTKFVGDIFGADWNAEIDCRDVRLGPVGKKKAKRK